MRAIVIALGLVLPAACGDFPTAGEPSGRAGYPELLPLSGLIGDAGSAREAADGDPDAALRARAQSLTQRADALRETAP